MQLLFATNNQGKLAEAKLLLQELPLELLSPADITAVSQYDVEETGHTFNDNALLKAKAFAEKSGVLTASDDSGLEVMALSGKPGVYSKRFAAGSDSDRNHKLLELMTGITDRTAQFRSVICLYDPQSKATHFFEGTVKGQIALEPKGEAGFGYDPLFIPDGYDRTFAELGTDIKNQLSHRAQALTALKTYLSPA